MNHESKTKTELIREEAELRRQLAALQARISAYEQNEHPGVPLGPRSGRRF